MRSLTFSLFFFIVVGLFMAPSAAPAPRSTQVAATEAAAPADAQKSTESKSADETVSEKSTGGTEAPKTQATGPCTNDAKKKATAAGGDALKKFNDQCAARKGKVTYTDQSGKTHTCIKDDDNNAADECHLVNAAVQQSVQNGTATFTATGSNTPITIPGSPETTPGSGITDATLSSGIADAFSQHPEALPAVITTSDTATQLQTLSQDPNVSDTTAAAPGGPTVSTSFGQATQLTPPNTSGDQPVTQNVSGAQPLTNTDTFASRFDAVNDTSNTDKGFFETVSDKVGSAKDSVLNYFGLGAGSDANAIPAESVTAQPPLSDTAAAPSGSSWLSNLSLSSFNPISSAEAAENPELTQEQMAKAISVNAPGDIDPTKDVAMRTMEIDGKSFSYFVPAEAGDTILPRSNSEGTGAPSEAVTPPESGSGSGDTTDQGATKTDTSAATDSGNNVTDSTNETTVGKPLVSTGSGSGTGTSGNGSGAAAGKNTSDNANDSANSAQQNSNNSTVSAIAQFLTGLFGAKAAPAPLAIAPAAAPITTSQPVTTANTNTTAAKIASAVSSVLNTINPISSAEAQPFNPASGQALADASNSACKVVGCNAPLIQKALGGVCAIESNGCDSNVPHGNQYQGFGQIGTAETATSINTLSNMANSPNLSPAEKTQIQSVVAASTAQLQQGRNPNADPVLGPWLLVGNHVAIGTLQKISATTNDPAVAAGLGMNGQLAPSTFKAGYNPNAPLSSAAVKNFQSNGYNVGYGSTALQAAQSVLQKFGQRVAQGSTWAAQYTPSDSPAPVIIGQAISGISAQYKGGAYGTPSIAVGHAGYSTGITRASEAPQSSPYFKDNQTGIGGTFSSDMSAAQRIQAAREEVAIERLVQQGKQIPVGAQFKNFTATLNPQSAANAAAANPAQGPYTAPRLVGSIPAGANPTIVSAMQEASKYLPPGYGVKIISAARESGQSVIGDASYHIQRDGAGNALAIDVSIIDPNGKSLENINAPQNFGLYREFMQNVKAIQDTMHPELASQGRWGGYFVSGNAQDLMHYDMGPSMQTAAGNWSTGLSSSYANYGAAGQTNQGMGGSYQLLAQSATGISTPYNAQTYTITDSSGAVISSNAALPPDAVGDDGTVRLLADADGNVLGSDGQKLVDGKQPLLVSSDATLPKPTVDGDTITFNDDRPLQPTPMNPWNGARTNTPYYAQPLPPQPQRFAGAPVPTTAPPAATTPAANPPSATTPISTAAPLAPQFSCSPQTIAKSSSMSSVVAWNCATGIASSTGFTATAPAGTMMVSIPASATLYHMAVSCLYNGIQSPTTDCDVKVTGATSTPAAPTLTIIANPAAVISGATSRVSWVSSGNECKVYVPGKAVIDGPGQDTTLTPALTQAIVIHVTCLGSNGGVVKSQTTIHVTGDSRDPIDGGVPDSPFPAATS